MKGVYWRFGVFMLTGFTALYINDTHYSHWFLGIGGLLSCIFGVTSMLTIALEDAGIVRVERKELL